MAKYAASRESRDKLPPHLQMFLGELYFTCAHPPLTPSTSAAFYHIT
jgi:hypothetical protein